MAKSGEAWERAERILTYYIKTAWEAADLEWLPDNEREIRDLFGHLRRAVEARDV